MITGFLGIHADSAKSCLAGSPSGRGFHLLLFFSGFQLNFLKKKSPGARGYTLLELIVVLVLLGLMLGLAVPKFRQTLMSDSLDATSLRIIGLVEDLRERAISDQVSYVLHFDMRGRKLWTFASNATEEEQEIARERAYLLPPDVKISDIWSWSKGKLYEETTIYFTKQGYVEQSMIHLQSLDGRQLSLELTPFLGSIKIHDGYVDFDRG